MGRKEDDKTEESRERKWNEMKRTDGQKKNGIEHLGKEGGGWEVVRENEREGRG